MQGVEGFSTPLHEREDVRMRREHDEFTDRPRACRHCDWEDTACGLTPNSTRCKRRHRENNDSDVHIANGKMYKKTKNVWKVVVSPETEAPNA